MNRLGSVRMRRWTLALGASIVAIGVASSPAAAQCGPDPTRANATTTCTGIDPDGLVVTTQGSKVNVSADAVIRSGRHAAIDVAATGVTLSIAGAVAGGSNAGIRLDVGAPYNVACNDRLPGAPVPCPAGYIYSAYPASASATIAIAAGASVGGAHALSVSLSPANYGATARADVTNAGAMSGSAGAAIIADLPQTGSFFYNQVSVVNAASGTIAGISGHVGSITNDGTITGVGGTAINISGPLSLTNLGTIDGAVRAGSSGNQGSTIDSSRGTIDGALTLGDGDDVLLARYVDGSIMTGITGAIDGGNGVDTLRLGIAADATLGAVALPTNFERLGLDVASGATATLVNGFAGPVLLGGTGTIINRTTLTGDTKLVGSAGFFDSPSFINAGTLRTLGAGGYAIQTNARAIDNQGVINAAGDGVSVDGSSATFANSGTITAGGTGVFGVGISFSNTGSVQSTGGTAARLSSGSARNSGTLTGAEAGVRLSGNLVNEGTISSPGTAILVNTYSVIDNRAGGRISGGTRAIASEYAVSLGRVDVTNAGTIDGDVLLNTDPDPDFYNGNRYVALPGGVLNGNLTIGGGDTLVTELAGSGDGRFAGITGTVSAINSGLRYRVRDTAIVSAAAPAGFIAVGYELFDGAALTLTGANAPLSFAGTGSVDVSGDMVVGSSPAIGRAAPLYVTGEPERDGGALAITTRGTLTLVRSADQGGAPGVAVSLSERDTYTNAGTILLGGAVSAASAGRIINTGTIRQVVGSAASDGINGTYSRIDLVNDGTIEVAGAAVRGSYNSTTIDNSGRLVSSASAAVIAGGYADTIVNRPGGVIAGSGTAVRMYGGTLTNAGTISGDVLLGFGDYGLSYAPTTYVAQGGTIAGDLRFGSGDDQFVSYGEATGVSGTIDAGEGYDTFVHARSTSATVTLGAPLLASFEREGARATGDGTVLTLRADAPLTADLLLSGDATIVNTATLSGSITAASAQLLPGADMSALAGLINRGDVTGTVVGTVRDFTNEGSISAARGAQQQTVLYLDGDAALTARNTGTIRGATILVGGDSGSPFIPDPRALTLGFSNSGTMSATRATLQLAASTYLPRETALSLDNQGTIEATGVAGVAVQLSAYGSAPSEVSRTIAVTNGGTIRADGGGGVIDTDYPYYLPGYRVPAVAVALSGGDDTTLSVTNAAPGVIEATGARSTAITAAGGAFSLTNAGTIRGGVGETIAYTSWYEPEGESYYLPGAIQGSDGGNTIVNSGTIIGSIDLGDGADRIESTGRIVGDIFLDDGDDRVTLAGSFGGAIDGGAGTDTVTVTGGTAATPIAFTRLTDVEQLSVTGGYATIAGAAALRQLDVTGGRLVGLAGSTISAPLITVARGATFGSAGTVDANLAIAGTLSPGASPGTMTVNGNVALAAGATALFEITPSVYDRLVVNGAVSIASGASLQLVSDTPLRAGTSYQLITATGGVNGAFTTVQLPGSQPGLVLQDAGSLRLLAQFAQPTSLAPQVANSVAYVNAALAAAPRDAALLAAVPALLDAAGATDARAFARLTPEAYASATQLGVDQALSLAQVARGGAFATDRAEAGAFTFAQTVGQWHRLAGDAASGSSAARAQSYGFLGGLGYGDRGWMVGAFAGYLNGRQQIGALGARTRADGVVAGVHARYTAPAGWGFSGSLLYDGGEARTDRALPGTVAASARYGLHSWVSDVSLHHTLAVGGDWTLRPRLGATVVRTTRDGVSEEGASRFALQVARERHVAGFVDAGLTLARDDGSDARFRPHVALGLRHQVEGRRVDALAGFTGGPLGLDAVGASRASVVGTAAAGVDYRLSAAVNLFSAATAQTGRDDHQETITTGVRLRF
ncbi:autotransporter domain-containing protein [Sphingomonas sp. BK069]|uniref:autotransporter domain-containing protein n=1 Tax=Sphingomonas sp. BK069 TaxID=2586979 RepID=UPI00161D7567|nr:autotransporter domain-containing protein [Sphingomonas sp. BK069]MBB3349644.1 hypothetical protein [Sphingomonas sp. BK069]